MILRKGIMISIEMKHQINDQSVVLNDFLLYIRHEHLIILSRRQCFWVKTKYYNYQKSAVCIYFKLVKPKIYKSINLCYNNPKNKTSTKN